MRARALFEDEESAEGARSRLHESTFKGRTIRAPDPKGVAGAQSGDASGLKKGSRLIIRNLPTDVSFHDLLSEEHLTDSNVSLAKITSIHSFRTTAPFFPFTFRKPLPKARGSSLGVLPSYG